MFDKLKLHGQVLMRGLVSFFALDSALLPYDFIKQIRWSRVLVLYMRVLSLIWIVKGLYFWALIFDVVPETIAFSLRPYAFQTMIVYFAALDLIAAVGLWLISVWGGVIWLLAISSHLLIALFWPGLESGLPLVNIVYVTFIFLYLFMSFMAANEA